ncbi:MAG: DUF4474 domain-containing protein [Lachnospiraceae bacterium]|nr:DUF4474 domain-containing protein [Lachnospiraceae bacterium]
MLFYNSLCRLKNSSNIFYEEIKDVFSDYTYCYNCVCYVNDLLAFVGPKALNFDMDDKNTALHAQVDTWQSKGGYNDIYDRVFHYGTNGNMDNIKFENSDRDYIVWSWRGNYLNLGSGAEIGLYQNPHILPIVNIEQWDKSDILLPMTLNLYNYCGENNIDNIFCWAPNKEQWWITGFNPDFDTPDYTKMVSLGTIDYTGHEELYNSLKDKTEKDYLLSKHMIFDKDGHTVWFIWWGK